MERSCKTPGACRSRIARDCTAFGDPILVVAICWISFGPVAAKKSHRSRIRCGTSGGDFGLQPWGAWTGYLNERCRACNPPNGSNSTETPYVSINRSVELAFLLVAYWC